MTRRLARLQLRDLLTWVALLLVVSLFLGVAALTTRPELPLWSQVEAWPGVGPLVSRVRGAYLVPDRPAGSAGALSAEDEPAAEPDREYVGIGAALRARPGGELLRRTRTLQQYEVVQRRGSWVEVLLGVVDDSPQTAWVDLAATRDQDEPPLGNAPEPPRPQEASAATQGQMNAVLGSLEQPFDQLEASGYAVLLGFRDATLRAKLVAEIARLEDQYRERYRLSPVGEAKETLVVFGSEASYRSFEEQVPRLAGLRSAGHSSRGLVALFRGDRSDDDVLGTVRHELAHLLNRRALGPALPPWLEEGIADDLALLAPLEGPDPYARYRFDLGNKTLYRGPLASLRLLLRERARGRLVPLQRMIGMDWDQFVRGEQSGLLYAQSAFFVSWLLESGSEDGLHRFLHSVSLGRPPGAGELSRALGKSVADLDVEFRAWLDLQVPTVP